MSASPEDRREDPPVYEQWLREELFEQAPLNINIVDREYRIVAANRKFAERFGPSVGRRCYEVLMGRSERCADCPVEATFADGEARVNESPGVDRHGEVAHYKVQVAPIRSPDGSIPFVIEMSTDITDTTRLKQEYQTLFEQVPCYVTVLDRDYSVIRANQRFRERFGDHRGRRCFEAYKQRGGACAACPARLTFEDGGLHTSEQTGVSREGEVTHYVVTSAPAARDGDRVTQVVEMAVDITELRAMEDLLRRAEALRQELLEHSTDAVVATGARGNVRLFNPAAERLLGLSAEAVLGRPVPPGLLPEAFGQLLAARGGERLIQTTWVRQGEEDEIPVRFSGFALRRDDEFLGVAALLQDLRRVKQLEKEKIDAERLAAVGQTVAGLAHGIKNILTGLEGGMYFLRSGLKGGRQERAEEGWEMLERNMGRISVLVRNLLSFSKGRVPRVEMVDPRRFVEDVVALYEDAAAREQVLVVAEAAGDVAPAPLDAEGIHSCVANLVSNAIDACQMGDRRPCRVFVRVRDEGSDLVFEVEDEGCGMDQKVRRLAFTTFFSTKGSGGTGLGLLLTRKIAQEHGGKIELTTVPGRGSTFRLVFPRDRLPEPGKEQPERG